MKKTSLMLFVVLLGAVLFGESAPRQSFRPEIEIPTGKLVNAIRLLNAHEVSYKHENGRYADRDQMVAFLRQKGLLSKSPIDLENPTPYELAITTTSDGTRYQLTLQRSSSVDDSFHEVGGTIRLYKSTWCKTAAFSDEKGVIFLGQAIGCEAAAR